MKIIKFSTLIALSSLLGASVATAAPVFFGPSSYLSEADIPVGFYQSGTPAFLENFEDGPGIGGSLTASAGAGTRYLGTADRRVSIDWSGSAPPLKVA